MGYLRSVFVVCFFGACGESMVPISPPDMAEIATPDLVMSPDMAHPVDMALPPPDLAGKMAGSRCTYTKQCPSYECEQPTNAPKGAQAVEACCDSPHNEVGDGDAGMGGSIGICCWSMFIAFNGLDLQCKDCDGGGWICKPI